MSLPLASLALILAQAPGSVQEVPNAMAPHTLFILFILAAFLVWAASFSVHAMQERTLRKSRETLVSRREGVLNAITRIELAYESGTIESTNYKKRMKALRGELARVVDQLRLAPEPSPAPNTDSQNKKKGKTAAKRKKKRT